MRFNFGVPEILRINLVLKLKVVNNNSGSETIKCAIKYSGDSLIINFLNLKKLNKKIIVCENLLLKKLPFGNNW